MYAVITHKPGHMYDVTLFREDGTRLWAYGQVYYTRWGARRAAKGWLRRAKRDAALTVSREEVRL